MNKKQKSILILSIVLIFFCLFTVVCLGILVSKRYLFDIDRVAINNSEYIRNDVLTNIVKVFTHIGSIFFLSVIAILVIVFVKDRKVKIFTALNIIEAGLFSTLFKFIFRRERPVDIALIEEVGYSFPSAHTVLTIAFLGFMVYLIYKYVKNRPLKIILSIFISIVIVLVGLSRVYLGVHFMTDVIAGWLLGLAVLVDTIVAFELVSRHKKHSEKI